MIFALSSVYTIKLPDGEVAIHHDTATVEAETEAAAEDAESREIGVKHPDAIIQSVVAWEAVWESSRRTP